MTRDELRDSTLTELQDYQDLAKRGLIQMDAAIRTLKETESLYHVADDLFSVCSSFKVAADGILFLANKAREQLTAITEQDHADDLPMLETQEIAVLYEMWGNPHSSMFEDIECVEYDLKKMSPDGFSEKRTQNIINVMNRKGYVYIGNDLNFRTMLELTQLGFDLLSAYHDKV